MPLSRLTPVTVLLLALLSSCSDGAPADTKIPKAEGVGGEGGHEPSLDCSKVPSKPLRIEQLTGPRAYHDIAFDKAGNLIGNDNADLVKTALGGTPKTLLAGVGQVAGMDTFENGDLAVATSNPDTGDWSLLRISSSGGEELIARDIILTYGVRLLPDGFLYLGTADGLVRVDPATGDKTTVPVDLACWKPRVMDYSPDKRKLYVGTLSCSEEPGVVYAFDLDEEGSPTGQPEVFAPKVGGGYHDALNVDACGNVFVADFKSLALYRITPEGEVTRFVDWNDWSHETVAYGHGIEWGSGVGGWEKNSIYLPQPFNGNTVVRVDVGVPARAR